MVYRKVESMMRAGILLAIFALWGCSEQPHGYIFAPQHRDQTGVTRQAADFLDNLYHHADQAISYLTAAAFTPNYRSIFPSGWYELSDSSRYRFIYSYLDQKLSIVELPVRNTPGAVRQPASVQYTYVELGSYQNVITSGFYASSRLMRKIDLAYSDHMQNINFVEGWFSYQRSLPFDYDIQVSLPGQGSATVSQRFYLPATWSARIEHYSTAINDYQSRIIIDGLYPLLDRAGNYQEPHVSATFTINRDGTGRGEVWFNGEQTAQVVLTGRSFKFQGYFTLYSEDHKVRYSL